MFLCVHVPTFKYQILTNVDTFNTPQRIVWQLPTEIPTFDAIRSTDFLLSLLTISGTCLTFALFVDIDGWPLHGSSSTLSHQSWKLLRQLQTRHFFIAVLPYTCCNMFHVSAGDFWGQTQNLIFFTLFYYSHFQLWCDLTYTLKKKASVVMPSEVMKWHDYFCDDVMHGANLWQKFRRCSNSCKLYQRIPGTFWSYYRQMSFAWTYEVLWLGSCSSVVVINRYL
jgi:hypothetical protein